MRWIGIKSRLMSSIFGSRPADSSSAAADAVGSGFNIIVVLWDVSLTGLAVAGPAD